MVISPYYETQITDISSSQRSTDACNIVIPVVTCRTAFFSFWWLSR